MIKLASCVNVSTPFVVVAQLDRFSRRLGIGTLLTFVDLRYLEIVRPLQDRSVLLICHMWLFKGVSFWHPFRNLIFKNQNDDLLKVLVYLYVSSINWWRISSSICFTFVFLLRQSWTNKVISELGVPFRWKYKKRIKRITSDTWPWIDLSICTT